jgi:hypothetical protein
MRIRASALGGIMTNSRNGKTFGETALTTLKDTYIESRYGRRKEIYSKYLKKGTEVEEASIDLLSERDGEIYFKNDERKENDWMSGECDIDNEAGDEIIDIKSSWDIYTFWNAKPPLEVKGNKTKLSAYGWQLTAYGWLWGRKNLRLAYVLSDTPNEIVEGTIYKNALQMPGGDENPNYEFMAAQVRRQHTFSEIPINERVRDFRFTIDPSDIDKIKSRIDQCQKIVKYWDENTLHAPIPLEYISLND